MKSKQREQENKNKRKLREREKRRKLREKKNLAYLKEREKKAKAKVKAKEKKMKLKQRKLQEREKRRKKKKKKAEQKKKARQKKSNSDLWPYDASEYFYENYYSAQQTTLNAENDSAELLPWPKLLAQIKDDDHASTRLQATNRATMERKWNALQKHVSEEEQRRDTKPPNSKTIL